MLESDKENDMNDEHRNVTVVTYDSATETPSTETVIHGETDFHHMPVVAVVDGHLCSSGCKWCSNMRVITAGNRNY
jgi:hypothetical protein